MIHSKPIILASASPRRRELLEKAGLEFVVEPSSFDERSICLPPDELVQELSLDKARAVAAHHKDALVIGADTIVVFEGEIFGKPNDEDEAVEMLSRMSGKWHIVHTGVTIIVNGEEETFEVRTRVKFHHLTREKIEWYVDEYSPLDKAGAYAVQDGFAVETYEGSLTNVIGLPMEELLERLKKYGVYDGND